MTSGVEPRLAATVVLLREAPGGFEVFLQRRVPSMAFAAGATVFPGGASADADDDLRATAVRETYEETGVALDPSSLAEWARWVTPDTEPIRFDAMFFVAALPDRAEPVASGTEMDRTYWLSPADALAAAERGELEVWPPTWATLVELAAYGTVGEVLAAAPSRPREPR